MRHGCDHSAVSVIRRTQNPAPSTEHSALFHLAFGEDATQRYTFAISPPFIRLLLRTYLQIALLTSQLRLTPVKNSFSSCRKVMRTAKLASWHVWILDIQIIHLSGAIAGGAGGENYTIIAFQAHSVSQASHEANDAVDDYNDISTGYGPRVSALQESGEISDLQPKFRTRHVFYPEATEERCTAALLLEIDPVGLVRNARPLRRGLRAEQYVNDRPYAASSFLSVAIAEVFGSALSGKSREKPELATQKLPLVAAQPVLPVAAERRCCVSFLSRWDIRLLCGNTRSTSNFPNGARAAIGRSSCERMQRCMTCSRISTCLSPRWMATNITGLATTKWKSCCVTAPVGLLHIRRRSRSSIVI